MPAVRRNRRAAGEMNWSASPTHQEESPVFVERLHNDPEDECVCCAGRGYRPWFDADLGWTHDECPACTGIASAGVFVLRLYCGQITYEQSWQARSLPVAVARAERWAELLRLHCRRVPVAGAEVRVLYRPADEYEETEVVHTVGIWSREPLEAA
jgi:hypothetical protein